MMWSAKKKMEGNNGMEQREETETKRNKIKRNDTIMHRVHDQHEQWIAHKTYIMPNNVQIKSARIELFLHIYEQKRIIESLYVVISIDFDAFVRFFSVLNETNIQFVLVFGLKLRRLPNLLLLLQKDRKKKWMRK